MILWFILPALPLLLYIGTYLSSMYMNTLVDPVVVYVFGSGRPSQENTELTEPSRLGILTEPSRAIPSRASRNIYVNFDFKNCLSSYIIAFL